MPLYKFYRIVPKDATQTDCYIGHTVQPLRKRFSAHFTKRNEDGACSSSLLFQRYGKEGLQIVLIHELELPDKEYARREERRLWEEVKEQAVNKLRPWRSKEERKEELATTAKQWYKHNKEAHQARQRQWFEQNKEAETARKKAHYARECALKYLRILLEQ